MKGPYSFLDFRDEKSFLNLQNRFLSYNSGESNLKDLETIIRKDFTIEHFNLSESISKLSSIIEQVSFFDFLKSGMELLAEDYENSLESLFEEKRIIFPEEKTKFIKLEIEILFKIQSQLHQFKFLPKEIRNGLNKQLDLCVDFLSSQEFSKIDSDRKIKCKLTRTSLIHLFYALRQNDIIDSDCSNSKLAHILNSYFLFEDKNTGEYKPIKFAGKVLSDNKTFNKTVKKSTDRLEDKFKDVSFFEIKIL